MDNFCLFDDIHFEESPSPALEISDSISSDMDHEENVPNEQYPDLSAALLQFMILFSISNRAMTFLLNILRIFTVENTPKDCAKRLAIL